VSWARLDEKLSLSTDFADAVAKCPLAGTLFLMALSHCAPLGIIYGSARRFKAQVAPLFEVPIADFEQALQTLHDAGLVHLYEADGERYLYVLNFHKFNDAFAWQRCPAPTVPLPACWQVPERLAALLKTGWTMAPAWSAKLSEANIQAPSDTPSIQSQPESRDYPEASRGIQDYPEASRGYPEAYDVTVRNDTVHDNTVSPPLSPSRGNGDSQPEKLPRNYANLEVDLERPDPALPWREWCKGKGGQPIQAARAGQILKGGTLKLAVYIPGEDGKRGRWEEQETNLDAAPREVRVELLAAAMNQVLLNERDRGNFRIVETRFAESLDKWVRGQPKVKRRTEAEVQAQVEEAKRLRKEFLANEAAKKQARTEADL